MIETLKAKLSTFRQKMYNTFKKRADATFELVDALSSNRDAKSIVELSLNPVHRRNYSSITRAVDEYYSGTSAKDHDIKNKTTKALLSEQCPDLVNRPFHLFAVDCTPNERIFSPTLKDRSPVYNPRPTVPTNKPVTIGHQYSVAVYLPEKLSEPTAPWVVPLSAERVSTDQKGVLVGMQQITSIINENKGFADRTCVSVADSAYSTPEALQEVAKNPNQIHISRLKSNRNLPRAFKQPTTKRKPKKGRPKKYGKSFILSNSSTWGLPAESDEFKIISQKGKVQIIKVTGWINLTIRSKLNVEPFRLVRIEIFKEDETPLFKRAMWVLIAGKKQYELSLRNIFESYRQRFDIEHFFRFGKTRLLLDKFQTPEVEHEEAWWQMVILAYTQLFIIRGIANNLPNPWERYLPEFKSERAEKSPSQAQKSFSRIIGEVGTPARAPKPRKKSIGRRKGDIQNKRQCYKIVYKVKKKGFQSSA